MGGAASKRGSLELVIEMRAKPGKPQELYQALQALLPTIRAEKGCRDCRVCRDIEDWEVFFLSVEWESMASLENYSHTESCSAFLGAVGLLAETARLRIGEDGTWEGIGSLKKLRKKT